MSKHKKVDEKKIKIKDEISGYDKDILIKTYRLPSGVLENFFIDDNKDSVQIFAVCEDGKVLTVKQFRPGLERVCVEVPGGGLESGEDPKEAAVRELIEETSFTGTLHHLFTDSYSPYSTGKRHCYVAWNCSQAKSTLDLDTNEFLRVGRLSLKEFEKMALKGQVRGHDLLYPAAKLIERVYGVHILD